VGILAKIKLIMRTVKMTKNFWQVSFLKRSPKKRQICFKNGVTLELDLAGYRKMRDLFCVLERHKFKVTKTAQGFVVSKSQPVFDCSVPPLEMLPFFDFLLMLAGQGWNVHQIDEKTVIVESKLDTYELESLANGLFVAKSNKVSFIGPVGSLMAYFLECLRGVYDCNYHGKTVLDVGGFCGETAVFFASQGAKKVVIYEPVKIHHELIRRNVAFNAINAELHEEGLGEKDSEVSINFDEAGLGFGLTNKGPKSLTIAVKSAEDILRQSQANIAKIDCEGAEINLTKVPKDILRLTPSYLIETHTKAIREAITKKFIESGFKESQTPKHLANEIYVVYFDKI
jgi:FkbM family methyltransferase